MGKKVGITVAVGKNPEIKCLEFASPKCARSDRVLVAEQNEARVLRASA